MMKNALFDIATLENAEYAPQDPLPLFSEWLARAKESEAHDHNALCLATVDSQGRPHARMVLLKDHGAAGFTFYTNSLSAKGQQLAAQPFAALCFHWKSLQRQVRITGAVEKVDNKTADEYFATRPRGRQAGAWASLQSDTLPTRATLAERVTEIESQYEGQDIPRPPHWTGYCLTPEAIEFWHNGDERLHTRLLYKRDVDGGWTRALLYP